MSKHTPGPWCFGTFHRLLVVPFIDGYPDKHHTIADLGEGAVPYTDAEEDYANARLIAAAPELLDALQGVMLSVAGCEKEHRWEVARAAIAKATGENHGL